MPASYRDLTALPVYNEVKHVSGVLDEVVRYAPHVLVVDDGSTDGTGRELARRDDILVLSHPSNRGYGAALKTAFDFAIAQDFDFLVTIDCDGQHEPQRIPDILAACRNVDIASGSRYLSTEGQSGVVPIERRRINHIITQELNCRLGLDLTDAFCGFKAYRVAALARLSITEAGYAMPLELWVQVVHHGLRIVEVPVPLVYLEEERSFGGALDDGQTRLNYYHQVLDRAFSNLSSDSGKTAGAAGAIGSARSSTFACTSADKSC